jgi:hypothetical protein
MIDLAMMIRHWGPIPQAAWAKVDLAYGAQARRAFAQALALIEDEAYLAACLQKMQMDSALLPLIRASLQASM